MQLEVFLAGSLRSPFDGLLFQCKRGLVVVVHDDVDNVFFVVGVRCFFL